MRYTESKKYWPVLIRPFMAGYESTPDTDRQFEKMEVFFGKKRKPVEDPPAQLMLF